MPRIQVYLPEGLYRQVKRRGLSPSELLQAAVRDELQRLDKVAELGRYLSELEPLVGQPLPGDEAWAKRVANRVKQHLRRGSARRAS